MKQVNGWWMPDWDEHYETAMVHSGTKGEHGSINKNKEIMH
jgi:hypothetical protein